MDPGGDLQSLSASTTNDMRSVANAVAEVKKVSHYTTKAGGGDGAVREVCERILKAKGRWNGLVQKLSGMVG